MYIYYIYICVCIYMYICIMCVCIYIYIYIIYIIIFLFFFFLPCWLLSVTAKEDQRRFPKSFVSRRRTRNSPSLLGNDEDARGPTVSVALLTVLGRSSDCYAAAARGCTCASVYLGYCCVRQSAAITAAASNQSLSCICLVRRPSRVSSFPSRNESLYACALVLFTM